MQRRMVLAAAFMAIAAACSGPETLASTTSMAAATTTTQPTTIVPASTTTVQPIDDRRPVILDFSPTVSDIGALAFIASHPDLNLIGVTLPGTGESYCDPGVAHTRGVLVALGLPAVPVACGPDKPVSGWNAFPTSWRVASSEMDLPEAAPNEDRSAPVLLGDLIRGSAGPVDIVAVGPLTNIAVALDAEPTLVDGISSITIMGGALEVPGNVFRNDVGEWNIWVDPTAAGTVLAAGAPVTLVPLDATNDLPTGRIFWESLDAAATTPAADLVRNVWASNGEWIDNRDGAFYFWDELAAAVLVDESLVSLETRRLVVDDAERDTKGWTREDPAGTRVRVAMAADRRGFEQQFIDTLTGDSAELGYLEAGTGETAYFAALGDVETAANEEFNEIFESVAADLTARRVDLENDAAFLAVVSEALSPIFSGPWPDRIAAIEALDAPATIRDLHETYLDALRAVREAEVELKQLLESGDGDGFDALFSPIGAACNALRDAAEIRLIEVGWRCG